MPPSLDTVPAEVRLNIFDFVLTTSIIYVGTVPYGEAIGKSTLDQKACCIQPKMNDLTSVLQTCRLFNSEASHLLFKDKVFYVYNNPDSLERAVKIFDRMSAADVRSVKRFVLNYQINNYENNATAKSWSSIAEEDGGRVIEREELIRARQKFCEAAAGKVKSLLVRIQTKNCANLTIGTFSENGHWLGPLLSIPSVETCGICVTSPKIPREPDNEEPEEYKARIEKHLAFEGVSVKVEPPTGNYCKSPCILMA